MIRTELDLRPLMPFTRLTAARLATAAGRYESRLTLECEGLVLNMKSMLGLLSQAKLPDGRAMLVADQAQLSHHATADLVDADAHGLATLGLVEAEEEHFVLLCGIDQGLRYCRLRRDGRGLPAAQVPP